jgi:hypothetical protein
MPPVRIRPRFDVVWFGQRDAKLDPEVFDRLNARDPDERGHYIVMPTTDRKLDIERAGNRLVHYHKSLNTDESRRPTFPNLSAEEMAGAIAERHVSAGFSTRWIFVNEISATRWPASPGYRRWVIDVARRLEGHGFDVAIFSPFATLHPNRPAGPDWKTLSDHAWIVIEGYLSGQKIREQMRHGDALAWCRHRYLEMRTSYERYGVPRRKLFIAEHFGHTQHGPRRNWGRCGIPEGDWVAAIEARSKAARDARFAGYVSFAWMYNQMQAPRPHLVRCCSTYADARLP